MTVIIDGATQDEVDAAINALETGDQGDDQMRPSEGNGN